MQVVENFDDYALSSDEYLSNSSDDQSSPSDDFEDDQQVSTSINGVEKEQFNIQDAP